MKKSFNDFACYFAIILLAAIYVITGILPHIGVVISVKVVDVMGVISNVLLIIGVAFGAMTYAKGSVFKKLILWIAIILYLLFAVFKVL